MTAKRAWNKTKDPLVYEKECLPVREITRWVSDDKEPVNVRVKKEFLERVVEQFNTFQEKGIRVPLFKTHKEDPDNDRGTVVGVAIKDNERGVPSLYAQVKFHNVKFRDLGLRNDVSVLCPPKFKDVDGDEYHYPLRHLALTSKPVVPGLQGFTPLVLSFDTESGLMLADEAPFTEESDVDPEKWAKLLELLGITAEEDADQNAQLDSAIAAVEELVGEEEVTEEEAEPAVALSYHPLMVNEMVKSRTAVIDSLVGDVITPARGKELKAQFATKAAIKSDIKLSTDEDSSTEFDRAIDFAKKMAADRPLLNTGRKTIKLSHDDADNPLVAAAKKAKEKASAKK